MTNDESIEAIEPSECGYYWVQFKDPFTKSWFQPQIASISQGWDHDDFGPKMIKFFDEDNFEHLADLYPNPKGGRNKLRFVSKIENIQVSAPKLKLPEQSVIEQILSDSDIVWTKYGSDTVELLAERIINKLKKD